MMTEMHGEFAAPPNGVDFCYDCGLCGERITLHVGPTVAGLRFQCGCGMWYKVHNQRIYMTKRSLRLINRWRKRNKLSRIEWRGLPTDG